MENQNQPISQRSLGDFLAQQGALPNPITPLSEEAVKTNVAALCAFPADDKRAVIYADATGQLKRLEGLSWAATYCTPNQDLQSLQSTIEKTFSAVLAPCDNQLQEWKTAKYQHEHFHEEQDYKGEGQTKNLTAKNIVEVERNLKQAEKMLIGLQNIRNSLVWQYASYKEDSPQQQALLKLNNTFRNCAERVTLDRFLLNKSIEKLPKASVDAASAARPITPAPAGVIGDPLRNIGDYLTYFGPDQVTTEQANAFIQEGSMLLTGILNGSIQNAKSYPGGYEKALNALTWKLMSLAMKKGQGHSHGSFAIEDTNGRLFAFLHTTDPVNRLSSHYKNRRVPGQEMFQQGVNVHTGTMPGHQHHLLIGQISNPIQDKAPLLFFKMESSDPAGGGIKDSIKHAGSFAKSLGRKVWGGNEGYGLSKEHVPHEVKAPFTTLIAALQSVEAVEGSIARIHHNMATEGFKIGDSLTAHSDLLASAFGISYMTRFLQEAQALRVPLDELALASFEKALSELYLDHLDKRTGNEVYLTEAELEE